MGIKNRGSSKLLPQVVSVNRGQVAQGIAHCQRDGLLLIGLAESFGDPAKDDDIDAVGCVDGDRDIKAPSNPPDVAQPTSTTQRTLHMNTHD